MWADVTADDQPDLYVTMNRTPVDMAELFYRNLDGVTFAEEAAVRGIDDFDTGSHGGVWGDLDGDGDYDLCNGSTLPALSRPLTSSEDAPTMNSEI